MCNIMSSALKSSLSPPACDSSSKSKQTELNKNNEILDTNFRKLKIINLATYSLSFSIMSDLVVKTADLALLILAPSAAASNAIVLTAGGISIAFALLGIGYGIATIVHLYNERTYKK